MSLSPGKQIESAGVAGGLRPYARHYRIGAAEGPAPALVYIGGTIPIDEYERRRVTEPTPILEQLERALELAPIARLDLFVCPCPIATGSLGPEWIVEHLDEDLLPTLGAAPTELGCIGYSAGGAYAAQLAAVAEAQVMAAYGPAGVRARLHGNRVLLERREESLEIGLFRNESDHIQTQEELARIGREHGARVFAPRAGGHPFVDYARNDTVRDCFAFVLERIAPSGRSE